MPRSMPMSSTIRLFLAIVAVATSMTAAEFVPMSADEALALAQPEADQRIEYADRENAFGDLRLPPGEGPYPVVILIHGGCWLAEYDLGYMSSLATAMTDAGVATWSIEYRRIGDDGGGWPGTFADVAAAADFLTTLAEEYPLDLGHVVAAGHSAGGHLALWLAARHRLPIDDPLRGAAPLRLDGVLSLAGIPDLAAYASPEGCGAAVSGLLGGQPDNQPERLLRASPVELLPLGLPQVLITGELDQIVPPSHAARYAYRSQGDEVRTVVIPQAGHFELIDPSSTAWPEVLAALDALLTD